MAQTTTPDPAIHTVRSADGTTIGYRQYGQGPGLLLIQGAMGTAVNYEQLATALARDFTVYLPDRRGRGMSPRPYTPDHTIDRDVADVEALLRQTGAHFVFGLSSGAIIALESARVLPGIDKIILYEPPFYVEPVPVQEIERVYREVDQQKTADAVISAFRIVQVGPAFFSFLPRFILRPMANFYLTEEEQKGVGRYTSTRQLIPTMRYDFKAVLGRGNQIPLYTGVRQPVLLLGGSKSPAYLKDALVALAKTLPNARQTEFKGLDHAAPWNSDKGGNPETVAQAIRAFLKG